MAGLGRNLFMGPILPLVHIVAVDLRSLELLGGQAEKLSADRNAGFDYYEDPFPLIALESGHDQLPVSFLRRAVVRGALHVPPPTSERLEQCGGINKSRAGCLSKC